MMLRDKNRILVDTIGRLSRRGATSHLKKIVNKTHAADLSIAFRSLSANQQNNLFNMIDDVEQKVTLFSELEEKDFLQIIKDVDINTIVEILNNMPSDDVADLIARMDEEQSELVLKKMHSEDSEEVEELLAYEKDTAGGIMVPEYISLSDSITAKAAIDSIQREFQEVEMPFYLYVEDDFGRLVGVSSLRQLVVVPPDTQLKEFMFTDIISVQTDIDQEEVAKIVARYDFLAVPVVDESHKIVGIVTVDDVIDIFRREATEDILKMAGAGEDFIETQTVLRSTKSRLPWLFASCVGGIVAIFVIGGFKDAITQYTYLAAFMPVILGMGGNIGTQSSTIVVRGLATNRLNVSELRTVVTKEVIIGMLLGIIYGFLIGFVAELQFHSEPQSLLFALSVGLAVVSSMVIAALVGSLVPMLFARINIDPAIATGPFVTTSIDILSVFFYFSIASLMLGI